MATRTRARILAALATLIVAVAFPVAAATPARAGTPQYVGFAIGNELACAPWHSGDTGLDLLQDVATVVIGTHPPYVGFVFEINGVGSTHPSTSLYWSYWHRTGSGAWTYSSSGAGSYQPLPGTVEGWIYNNGQTAPPSASTFAHACPQ